MWTRRQFLGNSVCMLGAAGTALALPGESSHIAIPDGSASRGMITPQADAAISRGLTYLAQNQDADGSYGTGPYRANVAVTSLAGMAFMAGGNLPDRGPYGQHVARALDFVLAQAERGPALGRGAHPPGFLHNPTGPRQHGPMYGHGFGTLFLSELYGMVSDRKLRERLRDILPKAILVIKNAQNTEGGWRYSPEPRDADLSVTICQIMALRSSRNAGFYVPKSCVDNCVAYVKQCQNSDGSFAYQRVNRRAFPGNQAFARTAAGVCALYSAGIYRGREVDDGLRYLMGYKPGRFGFPRQEMHYMYGHYYAAQAMWTAGGEYWTEWFPAIRDELVTRQRPGEGSWTDMNCAHYGTAMACIILQIPNNYLPILQK